MNNFLDIISGILLIIGFAIMIIAFVWWFTSEVHHMLRQNRLDRLHLRDTEILKDDVSKLQEKISILIKEIDEVKSAYAQQLETLINKIERLENSISNTNYNDSAF